MSSETQNRAGTVAIVGRPNVGKSTLLNTIVGEKLAIVTPKPQTTRNRIVGVWNGQGAQLVFLDTPGLHSARGQLNRFMVEEAMQSIDDVDAALVVVEAPSGPAKAGALPRSAERLDTTERRLLDRLKEAKLPTVLAINKVDTVKDKKTLLPLIELWQERFDFTAVVPVSAQKAIGTDGLVKELIRLVPEGPPLYAEDMLTDRTERFLVSELIREQLFLQLRQELPYATAVLIEQWEERADRGDVVIDATIVVERETQQGIVVGKSGSMIKELGTRARTEITNLLGRPAHLRLHVKVIADWSDSAQGLSRAGYER